MLHNTLKITVPYIRAFTVLIVKKRKLKGTGSVTL